MDTSYNFDVFFSVLLRALSFADNVDSILSHKRKSRDDIAQVSSSFKRFKPSASTSSLQSSYTNNTIGSSNSWNSSASQAKAALPHAASDGELHHVPSYGFISGLFE